jgi:SAM-dependent methyltransferase
VTSSWLEEAGLPPLAIRARLRYDVVARVVADLAPRSVLEAGCGQGAVGARLAAVAEYVGVEPDAESFAIARSRIEPRGGTVVNGTVEDLEPGRRFDLVCAFEVLEHIEDDVAALTQWAGRVAPGGHVLLSVPADQERFGPLDELAGHFRRYDEESLAEVARQSGLEVVSTPRYGWPLAHALEGVRNVLGARRARRERTIAIDQRTAASGRTAQPVRSAAGRAIELGTLPFRSAQRLRPDRGTGLLLVATPRSTR